MKKLNYRLRKCLDYQKPHEVYRQALRMVHLQPEFTSAAIQENFGISVIEAMLMGCVPLLPDRLSYPEILPEEFHEHFLYKNR
ncbi:MAG: hypothetical protein E4H43_03000 [Bacteroidia bacterium]|nr:MAG: hypothetical protein E4H43_03000 [Bacteroidia bacterium]